MRNTCLILVAVIVVALAYNLTGCDGFNKPPDQVSFNEAATTQMQGIHLESEKNENRRVADVKDKRILSVLQNSLKGAKPVNLPENWVWDTFTLFFNLPGEESNIRTSKHTYLFKGFSPSEPGYIQFPEGWYQVPGRFNILLWSLTEYRNASGDIDPADESFLKEYGWTPLFNINTFNFDLPKELQHHPGEYPVTIYWAYNNELNRDIGLDLSPHLSQTVEVRLYKIAEFLPEFMQPRREAGRAVVVRHQGEIIGAWLDAGRHYAFACSLKGRKIEEITGKAWDEWISSIIDLQDSTEQELAQMTPEEIINTYYSAINKGDLIKAHACESRKKLVSYLFSNMDNNNLYNSGYDYNNDDISNIRLAEVISIKGPRRVEGRDHSETTLIYAVLVDLQVKNFATYKSGVQQCFVNLRQEIPTTGWRIDSIGTGP